MTISRPLPRATPEATATSPLWKRVLATLVSVFVPGAGLVWADRFSSAWRWWLATAAGALPILVLVNLAPGQSVVIIWLYMLASLAIAAAQLGATWVATREVRAWRGRRAVLFALVAYVLTVGVATVAKRWIAESYMTPSASMSPSILQGDQFFVPKLRRDLTFRRGAVVVYRNDEDLIVLGRLVGLPDDVVEVHGNTVTVNGVAAAAAPCEPVTVDDYGVAGQPKRTNVEPCLRESLDGRSWRIAHDDDRPFFDGRWDVSAGHVFVMGDHRSHARDSRFSGPVPEDRVLGPVLAVWISFVPGTLRPRFERIGVEP